MKTCFFTNECSHCVVKKTTIVVHGILISVLLLLTSLLVRYYSTICSACPICPVVRRQSPARLEAAAGLCLLPMCENVIQLVTYRGQCRFNHSVVKCSWYFCIFYIRCARYGSFQVKRVIFNLWWWWWTNYKKMTPRMNTRLDAWRMYAQYSRVMRDFKSQYLC